MNTTVQQALQAAVKLLQSSPNLNSTSDSALEAAILLGHVLQKNRAWLYAWPEFELDPIQLEQFEALVEKRVNGEPVAYLTGNKEFWGINLKTTPDTLIPRPETELLVETALSYVTEPHAKVLELGTGSGAIAIALATEKPLWQIIATDRQQQTLNIARQNFSHHAPNIKSIVSNWFENIPDLQFDLIISNPPYVETGDPHLQQGDLRYEPIAALAAGADGLDDIRIITGSCRQFLKPGGYLIVEHGFNQATAVQKLFVQDGLKNNHTIKDLSGQARVTLGHS